MTESVLPLELDDVGFAVRGRWLLSGVSARLEAGVRTIIVGPNGAGKSLTLRIAHGLLTPSAGAVRWATPDERRVRSRQAMTFERPALLRRTAAGNVEFALWARGADRDERKSRTEFVLRETGLLDLARRPARVLSAGERQRLALARAWALEPEVLFLDEPTAALDPSATRAVESIVEAISESGTKVIMTTHDLGQARRLADEVLYFHAGKLVERASGERFFAEAETESARAFLRGELLW